MIVGFVGQGDELGGVVFKLVSADEAGERVTVHTSLF